MNLSSLLNKQIRGIKVEEAAFFGIEELPIQKLGLVKRDFNRLLDYCQPLPEPPSGQCNVTELGKGAMVPIKKTSNASVGCAAESMKSE